MPSERCPTRIRCATSSRTLTIIATRRSGPCERPATERHSAPRDMEALIEGTGDEKKGAQTVVRYIIVLNECAKPPHADHTIAPPRRPRSRYRLLLLPITREFIQVWWVGDVGGDPPFCIVGKACSSCSSWSVGSSIFWKAIFSSFIS